MKELIRAMFSEKRHSQVEPETRIGHPKTSKLATDNYPAFKTSATDRSGAAESAQIRFRLRDAFVPSQPVRSRSMLAGRIAVLQQLINAVEDQRAHVVLNGERGIGKTSLLRVFTEIAEQADYLVIYENCRASSCFEELFRDVAGQIPLRYHGNLSISDIQERDGGTFEDLIPSDRWTPDKVFHVLSQIIATRSIVILDEFDRVQDQNLKRGVAELIKDLSDSSARVQLIIAGVASNLQDLLGYSPSIRRNIRDITVARMSDAEIEQILGIGERFAGIIFEAAAKTEIVALAHGLPYLARVLAHFAAFAAVDAARANVTEDDVRAALTRAADVIEGQLSTPTLTAAKHWLRTKPQTVGMIARAGLLNGGYVPSAALSGHGDDPRVLEQLASTQKLLIKSEHAGGVEYQFGEDGVGLYLHLRTSAAQWHSNEEKC